MIDNLKRFLNENQEPKAVEKVVSKLSGLLMNGEELEYVAVQKKPAVNLSPDAIALTNKRILFFRPKNLGFSMEFEDYLWKDIRDCHLKEGILGAEFSVRTTMGKESKIDYLPKSQARRLYKSAQEQEEKQLEYRRQLELEEKRASAGNISLSTSTPSNFGSQPAGHTDDPLASLQKLKALLDNHLISQSEFDSTKAEIMKRL